MFINPTPGITTLHLTPMELVNWYRILIGLFSGIIAFLRILFATDNATENTKKRDQKGLIFMNEHEELTKEERELEMICKEIEWNSKRIISDRSRKRIKGLYYNKGLPIQSLRTLVDMGSALGMLGIDFLVATGETWAKAIRETGDPEPD